MAVILGAARASSLLALVATVVATTLSCRGEKPAGMSVWGFNDGLGIRPRTAPFPSGVMHLRLRGGMWYSGEEDSEDSYDDDDGDDDEDGSEEGGGETAQGDLSPRFEKEEEEGEHGKVFEGDGFVVPDENGSIVIPLGSWNTGRFRDIFEARYL